MSVGSHENLLDKLLEAKSQFIPSLHIFTPSSKSLPTAGWGLCLPFLPRCMAFPQEVLTIISIEYSYISEYAYFRQNSNGYYRIY